MMTLEPKIPPGPLETKWDRRRFSEKLVSPNNKRKITVIVVGTGLAGASEHDLPVEGRCVLDDDRNGHVRRRNRRRMHDAGEHRCCCQGHDDAAVENAGHEFHRIPP